LGKCAFSDEASFEIPLGILGSKCYRKKAQRLDRVSCAAQQNTPENNSVGCIGKRTTCGLRFIEETLDSNGYLRIVSDALPAIKQEVFGWEDFSFQQDNAPFHVSKMAVK